MIVLLKQSVILDSGNTSNRIPFLLLYYGDFIMELTSRDGNMVVDFYPVKDWNNNLINNRMLKVLSFRGDKQKKMLITRDEFYYQVREYVKDCKYNITSEYMPAQFINPKEVIA